MTDTVCFLSPRDLGHAIGVSESTVKRWIDGGRLRVMRTPGGHRRIPIGETIRFIREQRCDIDRPELLGIEPGTVESGLAGEALAAPLTTALEAGDEAQARRLVTGAFLAGQAVADLGDLAIRPALQRIGELWRHGDDGIAIEHHAVQILAGVLERLRAMLPHPGPDAPTAIGAGPSGDPYHLPSAMAALVLAERGWRTMNLGPDTPRAAFLSALGRHRPKLAWCSVCAPPSPGLGDDLAVLARHGMRIGTRLVVGGRSAPIPGPEAGWHRVESMRALGEYGYRLASLH